MKSMTGFGHGEASADGLVYRVEVSSVNRKQADIVVSLPRELVRLETQVRERIGESVSRGRVNVSINVSAAEESSNQLQVNEQLAQQYVDALRGLGEKLGLGAWSNHCLCNPSQCYHVQCHHARNYAQLPARECSC